VRTTLRWIYCALFTVPPAPAFAAPTNDAAAYVVLYTASRDTQRNSPGGLEPGFVVNEIPWSAPRLYLAAGVTALRTTGGIEPYTDLKVRARIEAGALPGPHIDVTPPYLEGAGSLFEAVRGQVGIR